MQLQRFALVLLAFASIEIMSAMASDYTDLSVVVRRDLHSTELAEEIAGVAKTCYDGFIANIPPSFCYKKGGDAGVIPTQCSSGYFRSLALCYQNCQSGYSFSAGVCYETCKAGYRNDPLSCYKDILHWYFKKSYIPSSYTNFDARTACPTGMYKSGALCYRDCAKVGLLNCGIGACAATSASCSSTIATIAIDILIQLGKAIAYIASLGEDDEVADLEEAESSVEAGFAKLGEGALKESLNNFKEVVNREGRAAFLKQVSAFALKNLAQKALEKLDTDTVTNICQNIGNKMLDKIGNASTVNLDWQSFDLDEDGEDNKATISDCSNIKSSSDQTKCVTAVLDQIVIVDPTGITGMAAAAMRPICKDI